MKLIDISARLGILRSRSKTAAPAEMCGAFSVSGILDGLFPSRVTRRKAFTTELREMMADMRRDEIPMAEQHEIIQLLRHRYYG